jgi:hypothetical protein
MSWRKHATTLVLVLLAIPLAVYAYKDRAHVSDTERHDREMDVFPAYRRQDVSKIELLHGGVTTTLERRFAGDAGDIEWWMTSPRTERADAAQVDKLLGDIEFAGIVRKLDQGVASFASPRVTGTVTMGAIVYRFALGGDAPTPKGAAYFRVDGEGAFVVSKDFVASLLRGDDAYRERTLVPYLSLELSRLEIHGRGARLALERLDDVSFTLPELGVRASRDNLDRVWSALAEARAESFLSDEDAERALGPDPISVSMKPRESNHAEGIAPGPPGNATPENASPRGDGELLFGGPCPGHPEDVVAVRRAPTKKSACVPKGLVAGLVVTSRELVDSRLFAARGDETVELTLESVPPGKKVEIARKGSGWHERSPVDQDLSSEQTDAANALVSALTKGEGTDVTAKGVARSDHLAWEGTVGRIRIGRGEGKGDEVIELGRTSSQGTLVQRHADGATLRISESLAHKLLPSPIVFRGRRIFESTLENKQASRAELDCDRVSQVLTRGERGWSYDKPSGYAPDLALVGDLVSDVVRAQADAWVADSDDGSFGFDGPPCTITLSLEQDGGPRKVGIVFGREATGGGYYAHGLGEEPVFLAPKSLHDDAGRLLVDRTAFHVDSAEVETVTLSRGATRLVLHGSAGKLHLDGAGGAEIAEKVAVSLDAMHADDVVHIGAPKPSEGFSRPSLDVRIKTRSDAGAREVHFVVGDSALLLKERMFYARIDGVDATFALARDHVADLMNAL